MSETSQTLSDLNTEYEKALAKIGNLEAELADVQQRIEAAATRQNALIRLTRQLSETLKESSTLLREATEQLDQAKERGDISEEAHTAKRTEFDTRLHQLTQRAATCNTELSATVEQSEQLILRQGDLQKELMNKRTQLASVMKQMKQLTSST